ncbi:MAG: hypothetical protein GXX85_09070 [Ignavibacteria bacterium]|nr:hypothetical protein [Ignavibacteria bacterium]
MKYLAFILFVSFAFFSCKEERIEKPDFKNITDSLSYLVGYDFADYHKKNGNTLNPDFVNQGMLDALGDTNLFTNEEVMSIKVRLQKDQEVKRAEKLKEQLKTNTDAGKKFIEKIKEDKNVVFDKSGLVYKIVQQGTGKVAKPEQTALMNLELKTIDGKLIYSTFEEQPVEKVINTNIIGVQMAFTIMPEGSTWELYLPAEQAYGDEGIPGYIEPGQYLIFKIEFIKLK